MGQSQVINNTLGVRAVVNKFTFQPPPSYYEEDHEHQILLTKTINENGIIGEDNVAFQIFKAKKETKTTIVFSHGNACDIGVMFDSIKQLHLSINDVNLIHYDYSGYGLSDGVPNEKNCYASLRGILKYCKDDLKIEPKDIILFGKSLGSGPTIEFASKEKFKGVILESGFLSCVRVVYNGVKNINKFLDNRSLDIFININKIDKITSPLFVMHGKKDTVVPFKHGEGLWEKAPCDYKYKFFVVVNAGHNDVEYFAGSERYCKYIKKFIEYCKNNQDCKNLNEEDKFVLFPIPIITESIEEKEK